MATFKNILIPVDSLYNAQIAAEKALELADSSETTLFLVATIRFDSFPQKLLYNSIPFQKKAIWNESKPFSERNWKHSKREYKKFLP